MNKAAYRRAAVQSGARRERPASPSFGSNRLWHDRELRTYERIEKVVFLGKPIAELLIESIGGLRAVNGNSVTAIVPAVFELADNLVNQIYAAAEPRTYEAYLRGKDNAASKHVLC
jgi:hypothetical protein